MIPDIVRLVVRRADARDPGADLFRPRQPPFFKTTQNLAGETRRAAAKSAHYDLEGINTVPRVASAIKMLRPSLRFSRSSR